MVATTGKPGAHRLHERHREPLLVRGEDEDIRAGHQPGGVGAGAEEDEMRPRGPVPRAVRATSSASSGPRPTETKRTGLPAATREPGCFEEHVVSLLTAQVGDREGEDLVVGHAELGPDLFTDRSRAPAAESGEAGPVHPVHHDAGPGAQRPGQGVARRYGHHDEGAVDATVDRLRALVSTAALFHKLCSVYTSVGRCGPGTR